MNRDQAQYYLRKLNFETDSADLIKAAKGNTPPVIVDGRTCDAFALEHIPGAINLPHRDISETSTAQLDKGRLYVCYCDGIGCNASTKTALKLLSLGFEVKELLGGIDWWKRDGLATTLDDSATPANCGC